MRFTLTQRLKSQRHPGFSCDGTGQRLSDAKLILANADLLVMAVRPLFQTRFELNNFKFASEIFLNSRESLESIRALSQSSIAMARAGFHAPRSV